jgi:hypothetical protein
MEIYHGAVYTESIPGSSFTDSSGVVHIVQSITGPPMTDSDGSTYLEYQVRDLGQTRVNSAVLYLLKIGADWSRTTTQLMSNAELNSGRFPEPVDSSLLPGRIIPDGQGGVLATWTISPSNMPFPPQPWHYYQAAHVVSGSVVVSYDLPFTPLALRLNDYPTLVLGDSSTVFASGRSVADGAAYDVMQLATFDLASGTPGWHYQVSTSTTTISMLASTDGGGVVAKSYNGSDSVMRFDAGGNPSFDAWTTSGFKAIDFVAADSFLASSLGSGLTSLVASGVPNDWPKNCPWAKPQADGRADPKVKVPLHIYQVDDSVYGSNQITDEVNATTDYWWKKGLIKLDWDGTIDNHTILGCDRTLHPFGCTDEQDLFMISSPSQYGEIKSKIDMSHGLTLIFTGRLKSKYNSSEPLDAVLGITPYTYQSGKFDPAAMISQLAPWQTVAHELGHTFQLPHYTTTDALVGLNPDDYWFGIDYWLAGYWQAYNNLMCGLNPPRTFCPAVPNTDLTADQIIKAHWAAVERSK